MQQRNKDCTFSFKMLALTALAHLGDTRAQAPPVHRHSPRTPQHAAAAVGQALGWGPGPIAATAATSTTPRVQPHFACQMSRLLSAFQLHAEDRWAETKTLLVIWKVGPVYFSSCPSPPATTRAHPRLKVTFPHRSQDISRGAHGSSSLCPQRGFSSVAF